LLSSPLADFDYFRHFADYRIADITPLYFRHFSQLRFSPPLRCCSAIAIFMIFDIALLADISAFIFTPPTLHLRRFRADFRATPH